jgi:PAS domain S-box-containing protein
MKGKHWPWIARSFAWPFNARQRGHPFPKVWAYLASAFAVIVVFLLKQVLLDHAVLQSPFLLVILPVFIGAWLGGFGPGLFATFLSALVVDYSYLSPQRILFTNDSSENIRLALFVAEGFFISFLTNRMHQAFQESATTRKHYQQLVESVKDYAIFTMDPDGNVTSWNTGAQNIFGFSENEILGESAAIVFTPEDRAQGCDKAEMKVAFEKGQAADERWHIRKDGSRFFASGMLTPLYAEEGELRGFTKVARDITQRKMTEDRLRQSEAEFRAIFELAGVGKMQADVESGKFIRVNAKFCEMIGYTVEELLQMRSWDLVHPDDRSRWIESIRSMSRGEMEDFAMEKRCLRKDGQTIWLAVNARIVRDVQRNTSRFTAVVQDITEKKRAETRLREQLEMLSLSNDAIIVRTLDGKIVFWNRGATELYGWNQEEVLGKSSHQLFRTQFQEPLESIHKTLFEKERWEGELTHYRRDGTALIIESRWVIRRSGERAPTILEINRDITQRKKAEQALRSSRERLELAQEAARFGTFEWDIQKNIVTRSKNFDLLYGLPEGSMGSTFEAWEKKLHPADVGFVREQVQRALMDGGFYTEFRIVWPDQSVHWMSARARVYFSNEGRPLRMVGVNYEITERKQLEQDLEQARGQLEQLVEERTSELRTAVEELKRSNRELEAFAYIASHDLQEPIRMVATYVQLLQNRYENKLDDDAREFIQFAREGSLRMKHLIDDLLSYSRIRRQPLELRPHSFEEIMDQSLLVLRDPLETSRAVVTHERLPSLVVDHSRIALLLQNLIGNAIKFRSEKPPRIHISAREGQDEWIFSVRDNGMGISPEYSQKIFSVFQRLHDRGVYPGTGMGLAVCRLIVEQHGGRIWVESEVGKGSTFYFSIPVSTERRMKKAFVEDIDIPETVPYEEHSHSERG